MDWTLQIPPGYDSAASPRVASFAAQLDDQLRRLKASLEGLEPVHLEWQPQPGVNSIGMLLAHLAIVDVWWIRIAPRGLTPPEADATFHDIIGIGMDDDGLPLASDGGHPAALSGQPLDRYVGIIGAARASTHNVLQTWRDVDLSSTYALRDRVISREWTIYHVLEHFCSHYGQILLLMHLMRNAGVLSRPSS